MNSNNGQEELIVEFLFEGKNSPIARDLKLNLQRLVGSDSALSPEESALVLFTIAHVLEYSPLMELGETRLQQLNFKEEEIREAREIPAIMGMLNTYYKFRYMVAKDDEYGPAGLRMTSLSKPALGRDRFEMLSLAVSALNGCEKCIRAHEKVLVDAGVTVPVIHDLVRLSATLKGLASLK